MYPHRQLIWLSLHKGALKRRIAARRIRCSEAASEVVQPLLWLDRAVTQWRQVSPFVKFVAVPLGVLLKKSAGPRLRVLGTLLRWGPLVLGAFRSLTASRGR